ncbi:hypothetical protein ELP00_23260 [Salmonella enterica subsp. enterica serovar Kiambu]|nr:hypothetical protein [Salmonella enterica subsp. enterica serovar Kiambu]
MFSREDYFDSLLCLTSQIETFYYVSDTVVQVRNIDTTFGAILLEKNRQLSDLVHQIKIKTFTIPLSPSLTINTRIRTIRQVRKMIIPVLAAAISISSA